MARVFRIHARSLTRLTVVHSSVISSFPLINMSNNSTVGTVAWVLVLVGALNWGLMGLGYFLGFQGNVVEMLLGSWPTVENVVYILVGASAVYKSMNCCK